MNNRWVKNIIRMTLGILFFLVAFSVPSKVYAASVGDVENFPYSKSVQSFEAPATGYYQLEVWGAAGGTGGGYAGGYGSYSTGITFLNKKDTLYVVTGEAGSACSGNSCVVQPKYNGGGGCRAYAYSSTTCAAGGGATHIAKVSGVLSSLTQYIGELSSSGDYYISDDILIVAGGGGGGAITNSSNHGKGGHAGGYIGGNAISTGAKDYVSNGYGLGATQIAGGCRYGGGQCGSFGQGFSDVTTNNGAANTGAGGGGFFGGGGTHVNSGGGGSGYIASSNLISRNGITKSMYCYGCSASTSDETKTVQVSAVSSNPVSSNAKSGSGYARITIKELTKTNSKLDSITVTDGTFVQEFNPETYVYDVVLDSESYETDISAVVQEDTSTIIGDGHYVIKSGTNQITLTVTADSGDVSIYQLNITRSPSPYKYLSDIKVNGESVPSFSPSTLEYNLVVNYDVEKVDLEAIYGRPDQTINLPETTSLKSGNNVFEIEVISEDRASTTIYKVNIFRKHTSKLKELSFDEYEFEFNPDTLSYTMDIMKSTISLSVNAVAYDEEAKISLSGFGYIKSSTTATITVTEPNCAPTVYTIKLEKAGSVSQEVFDFPYDGTVQEFVVPETAFYRLETWGAQGGTINSTYLGGYGAYSTGVALLKKDEIVYVVPGQAGAYCRGNSCIIQPRFNGGGGCRAYYTGNPYCGSGGGATHMATSSGQLSSLSNDKDSVLIVSGGGGGAGYTNTSNHGKGGHAGGYIGGNAISTGAKDYAANGYGTGGTQTTGGCRTKGGKCGSFGLGFSDTSTNNGAANTGAGGGGYYGGGGTNVNSGGGGSGYIASSRLRSYKEVTKVMYCYSCSTTSSESTYTVSTKNVSAQPVSYYAKSGNGYARITALAQASPNNFLTTITTDKGTLSPEYDMETKDYTVDLTPEDDTITLDAVLEDETATLSGIGEFDVPAGTTKFPITVTAENGDIRIYTVTVNREKSSNPYPNSIKIEGLVPSLCAQNDNYCKLNQDFHPDTDSYTMTVASRQKEIEFVVEKGHKYQTVTGDGKVELKTGMNVVTIKVTSEDGNYTATYTYHINRDMSGDNTIEKLEVVDPVTDIGFDPDVTEYYFSIPNNYTKVKLDITLDDPQATYEVIGNENFESGLNIVNIVVTAQNGEQKTYTLNIYREQSGNTFLSWLEVSNDKEIFDLNPTFNKILSTYTVKVENEIDEVEIIATPEHALTVVTGAGTKTLKVGTNTFQLTSTAEDGSVQVYQVAIIRAKNSDATLKTLEAAEGVLTPDFQSVNLEYSIDVNPGVTSLNLTIEPTATTSKYTIAGNYGFKVGVDNIVSIVVTAEDGTKNTYKIHVNRIPSTNNYLSYLNTDKYDMTTVFDKEIEEYNITVENEVSSIKVDAIPEDKLSTVSGNTSYNLKVGDNDIDVMVISEEGITRTYTLHVYRKSNNNTNLSSLTTDLVPILTPTFDKDTLDYTVTVGNEVEEIAIIGTPEVTTSKVTGNGVYSLQSGENVFKMIVEAEDGSTKEYSLVVTKEKSDNANLSMIIAKESVLDPSFDKNKTEYVLKVIESVTSLSLIIKPENPKATYKVIGNEDFVIGHNTVTIEVTAEDGITTKEYTLDVLRQEAGTTSNRLDSLTVDKGTLNPTFHPDTNYYEVEVPYAISDITLSGELEDKNATVTGFGTYSLEVGVNVLSVTVTSVENVVRYYQVVVTRKKNDEARLASLQVLDSTLSPNFNKDTYQYSLSTTLTELNIVATPLDSKASVQVIGNSNLQLGTNQVIVRVTAHDGITTKDYTLQVEKEKSSNNNLQSLEVENYTYTPEFSKTTTVYYLDVEHDIDTIRVNAVAEDLNATIDGDGDVNLTVGVNYVEITVTSEAGSKKVYTIIVTRKANDNNYLSSLEVSSGELSPEFDKTVNDYTVTVPYEVEEITLSGLPEDSNATVVGLDKYQLDVGENILSVVVTGEDGTTNTYTVSVTREKIVSSQLKELTVKNYQLNQTFNPDVYDYNVVVDSEVTALDLTAIPLDSDATYQIIGNENFIVGMNKVEIIVTDSLGKDTSTYTLNVNRQNYANTYLAYIYPSKGSLSPNFDKTNLWYTVTVDGSVDTIDIMADVEVSTNTLTGDGTYTLQSGVNKISLVVTTPSGISRTYYVNVIKNLNNNNDLETLEVTANGVQQTLTPTFDKSTLNYTVNVGEGVTNINISATADKSATISGIGNKTINVGENNFEIVVTAEDGSVKKYYLKVNREASSNNHLIDIIPSVGTLNPAFSYTLEEYSLVLDASSSTLSFDVVTEDINAKVKGNEIQVIPDGLSKREISVEAEDGSIRKYTINVYKEKTDEARLSNLELDGFTFNETFDKDTFNYTVTVPNEKNVILSSEVTAVPLDNAATVSKTTSLVLSSTTANIYTIIVTAKDGFTKQTYTITIEREKGGDSTLSKLEFVSGNLTEPFVPTKTEYTLQISKNTVINSSDVTAIPTDNDATVTIPYTFAYDDSHNVYEITVESPDKSSTTIYKINLEIVESSNALLSSLSVDHGILSPTFDKMHNDYTLELDSEVDTLEISATAEDQNSTITGDGTQTVVTGLNRYEVVVTAEDGTVNTYVIEATREKSSNTNIIDIIPSSGSLSPSYSNEIDTYQVEVGEEIDTIDFEVQLESKRATVIGDKGNSLDYGENNLTIIVEAEDGTTMEVYINVIREKKITDIEVPEEILMDIGDIEVVEPIITPNDATYKDLVWESSDTDIVTVTDGTLEAKALGEAVITVSSARDSTIQKEIKVRVVNLKISSDIYEVRRNVLFLDDDSQIQHLIIGAEVLEDLDTFISKLKNEKELIKIYTIDGVEITDTVTTTVSTGQIIRLEYNGKVYDSVYMVVRGEITKDGVIDADDYNSLAKQVLSKQKYDNDSLEFKASDVVETDEIDVDDSSKEARIVLKKN